jgi:hypothetical protein
MIKLLPLLLLAYYLARGRWCLVLSAAAVSLFLLGATRLVVGAPTLLHAQAIFGSGYHFASSPDNLALARAPIWLAAAFGHHTAMLADGLGRGLIAFVGMLFTGGLVVVWRAQGGWSSGAPPE